MSTTATGSKDKRKPQAKKSAAQRAAEAKQAAEAKEADTGGTAVPLGARIRARVGESGARSVLVAVRAGLMIGSGLAGYVLAMFVAVTVVPNLFVVVSTGTGVGPTSPLELQLVHWLAPSLFLIGLVFVLVLVAVRSLWLAQRRLGEKARRALLGDAEDTALTTDGAGR
ncbi:hypothetical protein PWG71_21420 [Nocardiopsis sp. N85]|uniref:hypothetical protein n=1 Tax=Nocardiopsis sp. N85 TaxID=3029400 RepID=UPI00237F649A|nr:hypothetical protein [Nocardiopsis sp. N85]MDE3723958.1 hypothetical protein [Nocardiopsis sp. N85]